MGVNRAYVLRSQGLSTLVVVGAVFARLRYRWPAQGDRPSLLSLPRRNVEMEHYASTADLNMFASSAGGKVVLITGTTEVARATAAAFGNVGYVKLALQSTYIIALTPLVSPARTWSLVIATRSQERQLWMLSRNAEGASYWSLSLSHYFELTLPSIFTLQPRILPTHGRDRLGASSCPVPIRFGYVRAY